MGYNVRLTESSFIIPESLDVLDAIYEMDERYDAIKRGGSRHGERWFSWMPPSLTLLTSVHDVFSTLGFNCKVYDDEKIWLRWYENKSGQEGLFLAAVAPFVDEGAYTEWQGEDGLEWRYEVQDGRLFKRVKAKSSIQHDAGDWSWALPYTYQASLTLGSRFLSCPIDPYKDVDSQLAEFAAS
jgi:hypothetical protein